MVRKEWEIALTVRHGGLDAKLSPFFAKAGGILFVNPAAGDIDFVPNRCGSSAWVCDEILGRRVRRVVTGFIGASAARRFEEAGIDVRFGPCTVSANDLIARFHTLPRVAGQSVGSIPRKAR